MTSFMVIPFCHSMYRQPAADKMTDVPELHSGQIMRLNSRFLKLFTGKSLKSTFQKLKTNIGTRYQKGNHQVVGYYILCLPSDVHKYTLGKRGKGLLPKSLSHF